LFRAANVYFYAVVVFGEVGFGELQFEFGEDIERDANWFSLRSDAFGHLDQNAVNLDEFFFQEANEFVVLLDGFERLDKYGLAAGAGAVDNPLHAPLLFDLYRDDEAVSADRDEFVLDCAAFG